MRKVLLLFILVIITPLIFSVTSEAKSYYLAGLRAYQMQDCVNAIKWFEKALVKDSSIEEYDPQVKFKIGYCAYLLGDYDMAKDYLSLYPDNPVAVSLLKSIGKAREKDSWKKWLDIPKENQTIVATATKEATKTKESKKSSIPFKVYLLMFGIFLIIYASIFFLELKTGIITRLMMKLLGGSISAETVEVKQVAAEIEEEKKEVEIEEKEVEFELEEILNASLDTVDKLIYGDSFGFEGREFEEEKKEKTHASKENLDEQQKAEVQETKALKEEEAPSEEEMKEEEGERTEKEVVIEELAHQEERDKEALTEEDEDEVLRKANEVLKELEDVEEGTPIDLAGKDIDELMEELEEKDSYGPEDAEAFMYILTNLIEGQSIEEQGAKEEANS